MSSDDPSNNVAESEIEELKKKPYVKDLLVKLDVLKNAIIKDRKSISALKAQIEQLQTELNNKENEIRNLCKEKVKLENDLQLEKKKLQKKEESFLQMANAFGKSSAINTNKFGIKKNDEEKNKNENDDKMVSLIGNSEKIDQLNEEIAQLKFENETYSKKMNQAMVQNENLRIEFKNLLKSQTDKMCSLDNDLKKIQTENEKLKKEMVLKDATVNEAYNEKRHYESLFQDLKNSKESALLQAQSCLNKCERLVIENQTYRERLAQHEIDATKLGEKLAEYKNVLIKINTKVQIYQVLKVGLMTNTKMDITFGQDKDNNYVMRIDDDSKHIELVNILDVNYFKQLNNSNKVEICYMYESKKKKIIVIVEDLVLDQFLDAYKNFFAEAIKMQNKK